MRAATAPSTACTEFSKGSVTGAADRTAGGPVVTAPGVVAGDAGDAGDACVAGDVVEGTVGAVTEETPDARTDARAGTLGAAVVNGDAATAAAAAACCRVVEVVAVAAVVVVIGPDAARPAEGVTVVPHPAAHAASIATAVARADRTVTNRTGREASRSG